MWQSPSRCATRDEARNTARECSPSAAISAPRIGSARPAGRAVGAGAAAGAARAWRSFQAQRARQPPGEAPGGSSAAHLARLGPDARDGGEQLRPEQKARAAAARGEPPPRRPNPGLRIDTGKSTASP